jgi:hypothetical protein
MAIPTLPNFPFGAALNGMAMATVSAISATRTFETLFIGLSFEEIS